MIHRFQSFCRENRGSSTTPSSPMWFSMFQSLLASFVALSPSNQKIISAPMIVQVHSRFLMNRSYLPSLKVFPQGGMKVPSRLHHLLQFQVIYGSFLVTKDLLLRGKRNVFCQLFWSCPKGDQCHVTYIDQIFHHNQSKNNSNFDHNSIVISYILPQIGGPGLSLFFV